MPIGVRRHLQPALRRHQPGHRRAGVHRQHPGRPGLARLRGRRAGGAKFASDYFQQLYDWAEDPDRQGFGLRRRSGRRDDIRAAGGLRRTGNREPVPGPPRRRRTWSLFRGMRDGRNSQTARRCCGPRSTCSTRTCSCGTRAVPDPSLPPHHRTGDCVDHLPDLRLGPRPVRCHRGRHPLAVHPGVLATIDALYDWCLDQLDLPYPTKPEQTEFARLKPDPHGDCRSASWPSSWPTVTSTAGTIPGMPTLRAGSVGGATRRRPSGPLCDKIGVAKTNSVHDIELLESFIRTELNATALRRMAVLRPLKVTITNWPTEGRQPRGHALRRSTTRRRRGRHPSRCRSPAHALDRTGRLQASSHRRSTTA